jgi:sigma-B regulation protein RsbU (phosphoserine phosphatase)
MPSRFFVKGRAMKNDAWEAELRFVVDLMRDVSKEKDPQKAANLYGGRLVEQGPVRADMWMSLSRRGLEQPWYRITRSSTWEEDINPWTQKEKLPLLERGLLGELIYSDEPAVITDLQSRVKSDDPARAYFQDMNMLLAIPHFDEGEALNMAITMFKDPTSFQMERFPSMVWQGNLWGRATLGMVLRKQLKEAYDELDRELRVVENIQRSLLPKELPAIAGLDLAAFYQTSKRAGGDYYDLFPLPDGKWGFFVADVSGHGTPAAVMMAITHAIAHSHPGPPLPPASVLAYINRKLVSRYTGELVAFVTAFYAVYDPATRRLTFASAGHNAPRWRHDGRVRSLDGPDGLPLGIEDTMGFTEHEVTLAPGDALLMYTDGITEAMNAQSAMFGVHRLDAVVAKPITTSQGLLDEVMREVNGFVAGASINDDRTLLALMVK